MLHPSTLLLSLALATPLAAQLTPIAPFTGQRQEGFETQSYSACVPGRVFQNTADFCTPGYSGVLVTYGWLLYVGYAVYPRNNSNSFAGTSLGNGVFTFDTPVQRFGAYLGTVGYLAGGTARFFDATNTLIGTQSLTAPRGGWAWNGWDVGHGGTKIKRVELIANDPYNGGALICVEDAEIDLSLGTITTTPMGCGALPIAATGLPVIGDTVTFSLGSGPAAASGFLLGTPTPPVALPICPGCTVGVNGFLVTGNSFVLDIPNDPALLDVAVSAQGFRWNGGPCLGGFSVSARADVWIGLN